MASSLFALVLAALSAVMTIIGPDKIGRMATIMSDGLTHRHRPRRHCEGRRVPCR
ncbi:MAG: hypothetical protein ACLRSD_12220 [Oscillibacter sp.]